MLTVGNEALIYTRFYVDSALTNADASVTCTVVTADGTAVSSGAATNVSTGLYSYNIAAQSSPVLLVATWTCDIGSKARENVTHEEVYGNYIFELAELESQNGIGGVFNTDQIATARRQVTDFFHEFTDTAFVLRRALEVRDGNGSNAMNVHSYPARSIISVKVDGVAETTTDWTLSEGGLLRAPSGWATADTVGQNIEIQYTYGHDRPPADVRRAALMLARHFLLGSNSSIPDRARMIFTGSGQFMLDVASENNPTGLPEVDSVLRRYRRKGFGFA